MATDKNRFTVSVDDEMMKQIEDFRFANRYSVRSDAVAKLIQLGIESLLKNGDIDIPKIRSDFLACLKDEPDGKENGA